MTSMIERVARALSGQYGKLFDDCATDRADLRRRFRDDPSFDINEPTQADHLDAARAAIEEMREPTEAMIAAANETPGIKDVDSALIVASAHGYTLQWRAQGARPPLVEAYTAMISQPLTEGAE